MATNRLLLLLLVVVTVGHVMDGADGVSLDHIVGGSLGWRLPPNVTFYEEWTRNKTFVVGDKLVFMFTSALQNVLQVSQKDYEECTQEHVVDRYYAGPTVLMINESGPHYYYCGIGLHCEGGQKLAINVSATPLPDPARDGLPAQGPGAEGTEKLNNVAASGGVRPAAATVAGLLLPWFIAVLFV
ncbi:hypothetical protein Taro_008238 [Colocasia esculenta]|uniref:Phytocyanin domain-containing protein n=1 Tax=Colocasia esculenta TaxID=4460 RepID=A0A843TXN5_COLES|nr:hypothetical protein [Colocasia esculenta]